MSHPVTLALASNAVIRMIPAQENLPDDSTGSGNLFHDRYDPNLMWYLPGFRLADDSDAAFAFSATQSGEIDTSGNPLNHATLTVGLVKTMPDDVAAFHAHNPSAALREIPLKGLTATLSTTANDPASGAPTPNSYTGTLSVANDSTLTLTVADLLGTGVLIAYQNLRTTGATLGLSATYDVWHKSVVRRPFPVMRPPGEVAVAPPQVMESAAIRPLMPRDRINATTPLLPVVANAHDHPTPIPVYQPTPFPLVTVSYTQGTGSFSLSLAVGAKYDAPEYARGYTIADAQGTHAIATIDDLKGFDVDQSEFSEFTALGDISQKYRSFSRLYVGALSRKIVAVPATYGIVRSSSGTAAVCRAVLDSSATGSGACRFEFSFTIAAVYSPIELAQLQQDVKANAASGDCVVVLPERLDVKNPSTLATTFGTVTYATGDQPQTFSVTLSITDGNALGSAVAGANLLIGQLTTQVEPYLQGSLFIALDDYYPNPVAAGVTLNFTTTAITDPSDDLVQDFDPTAQAMTLVNPSPLDLQVTRYAVVSTPLAPQPFPVTIPAKGEAAVPASGLAANSSLFVDRTLSLESPITKTDTQRYLAFDIHDVQNVQYQFGLLASAVNFAGRRIARLDVAIALNDLPSITVPHFTVTAQDQLGEVFVVLPLQYALSALNATVAITIVFADPTVPPTSFSRVNDFVAQPVLVLTDQDIPT